MLGKRRIRGGGEAVRSKLRMAALVACEHNPALEAMRTRLVARSEPPKATLAVVRLLLIPTRLDIDLCPVSGGDGCDAFGVLHGPVTS